jgi:MFS family permease
MSAVPDPSPVPEPPREGLWQSLHATRKEAKYSAVMNGLTEPFMIPYVLALGASTFQAGLLSSVRNLLLSLVQLGAADVVGWLGSRRRVVLVTAAVQAALWVPLAFAAPLFGPWVVAGVIACYTLGTASAALGGPAWGSLVAEYLPASARGRFFGHRARVLGLWATLAGIVAGAVLHLAGDRRLLGFGILCAAAGVSRCLSWRWLTRLGEEPWREAPHLRFSFWQFLRAVRRSNFARFSCCMAGVSLATHLAAPFFAVYLLQELHFGYLAYTTVVLAGSVVAFVTSPWWGRVGDRFGNHAVLRWAVVGVSVLPALWPVCSHPAWLAAMNVCGAFLWGGLNLSAANFVYDAVTPAKRHTCLAYFNVVNGLGVSLGALLGGWGIRELPPLSGSSLVTLFYVSTALRIVAALAFRRFVREVRAVRPAGLRELVLDLFGQRLVQVRDQAATSAGTAPRAPGRRGTTRPA